MNNNTPTPTQALDWARSDLDNFIEDQSLNKDYAVTQLRGLLADFERFIEQAKTALDGDHTLPGGFDLVSMATKIDTAESERVAAARNVKRFKRLVEMIATD